MAQPQTDCGYRVNGIGHQIWASQTLCCDWYHHTGQNQTLVQASFFFFLKTTISCTHMVNSQNTGVSAGLLQSSRNLQWYVHFNISDEPLHDQSCRDNRLKVGLIHENLWQNAEYYCPSTWHLVSQWHMPFKWPPVTVPLTHQLKSPVALLDLWPPVVIMHRINCCAAHPYTTAYIKLHQNQSWRK